jgi:hypothetical protein
MCYTYNFFIPSMALNPFERFVERHIDEDWNWGNSAGGLSSNPSITPAFIERHMDKPWEWGYLSSNPSMTFEFIERNMDKPWYWYSMSKNPFPTEMENWKIYNKFMTGVKIPEWITVSL